MKRITSAIICLLGLYFVSGSISAQPKDPNKPKPDMPSQVTGVGTTVAKAQEVALREAVKVVKAKGYSADEEFVRDHMLVDEGRAGDDLKIDNIDEPFKSWVVTFRYNGWNEVARLERATEREHLARNGMFGLSILLLVGMGYVRLDDYTNHRYTAWLRAAGSGVVALILAITWYCIGG